MNICIFASSCDVGEGVAKAVYDLGRRLGEEGHALVFGGYGCYVLVHLCHMR